MTPDAKMLFRLAAGFGYASAVATGGEFQTMISECEFAIELMDGCKSIDEMIEIAGTIVEAMRINHGRIGEIN